MKRRIKVIDFPVFASYVVHIEVTSDLRRSMSRYPQTEMIDVDDDTHAMAVHEAHNGMSFMFLPYNSTPGTIAHESWHIILRMMDYLGVENDSETMAYHLGYLVDQVWKLMK